MHDYLFLKFYSKHKQNIFEGQNQQSITRHRLPSGRDESAPSPYRDQNIRNVANVLNAKFQQPQQQFDELPGKFLILFF